MRTPRTPSFTLLRTFKAKASRQFLFSYHAGQVPVVLPVLSDQRCSPAPEGSAMPQRSLPSAAHLGRPNLKGASFQSSSTGDHQDPRQLLQVGSLLLPLKCSRHCSRMTGMVSGTGAGSSLRDMALGRTPRMAGMGPTSTAPKPGEQDRPEMAARPSEEATARW